MEGWLWEDEKQLAKLGVRKGSQMCTVPAASQIGFYFGLLPSRSWNYPRLRTRARRSAGRALARPWLPRDSRPRPPPSRPSLCGRDGREPGGDNPAGSVQCPADTLHPASVPGVGCWAMLPGARLALLGGRGAGKEEQLPGWPLTGPGRRGAFPEAGAGLAGECPGLARVGTAGAMTATILPLEFEHYPSQRLGEPLKRILSVYG